MFHNLHEFNAPPAPSDGKHKVSGDLTVRDYFAAKALQGLLANPDFDAQLAITIASSCYDVADKMMEIRK